MKKTGKVLALILALLLIVVLYNSLYTVQPKEYVAVRQFGRIVNVVDTPGLRAKIPFVQTIQRISAATILYDIPASDVITKDKKSMISDNYVLWRVTNPTLYIQTLNAVDARAAERIEAAAKYSDVHKDITEFRDGYKTVLGERGVTVSGGQKQRISIARALLKDAPVLILDDSVSAVDTKTEKSILENLHNTRQGKTTVLIAHRISTIEKMDKIIFVEDGTVSAVGKHEELYASSAEYRRMVDLQKLEEEEGGHSNA